MLRSGMPEVQPPRDRAIPRSISQGASLRPDKGNQLLALMALVGALVYLISPLDLVPDLIPGLCHLDDIGVMGMAIKYFKKSFC